MIRRVLLVMVVFWLAGCAAPAPVSDPPTRASTMSAVLAPFEDAAHIPPQITRLPFAPGRAYAIVVQIPAPSIVDLSSPRRAQRGLVRFLDPLATLRAGTQLGHTMAGWRCADGTIGLVSKTGDSGNVGLRMLMRGWGLAAFLSEYRDGRLYEAAQINPRHRRVMRAGRTRIVALEIPQERCQAMRRALARYRTHPDRPEQGYTMLHDPALMRGDGCAEFALWLVGQGGVLAPLVPEMRRDIALRTAFVGRGAAVAGPVAPFVAPGIDRPVSLWRLLTGDWLAGEAVATVRVLDMELLRLVLDRAYARTGPVAPRLRPDDAQAVRLRSSADAWLARYPVTRPVRIGQAQAIILERR